MAIEIGALRALLSLDSAAFEKGAKRAQASMNGLQRSLSRAAAKMQSVGKKMTTRATLPIVAMGGAALRSSMQTIDAQSKMAQSLGTSTKSMQVLARAADRAGVSTGELEQIGRQLTKRLSQAATGAGPAAKSLARLGLSAETLSEMNLDERISAINTAIAENIPVAEQAAVAATIFGDRAGLVAARLDPATIAAANAEIERFGLAVTEIEADQIEEANDALSAIGLVVKGLGNQLAVALAPTLKRVAEAIADMGAWFSQLTPQQQRFAAAAATVAAAIGPLAIALGFIATGLAALASPVGLVVLGFSALAGAAAYVVANWDTLKTRFPILADAANLLGQAWDGLKALATERFGQIKTVVTETINAITALFNGDLAGALESIKTVFSTLGEMITQNLGFAVQAIKTMLPEFVSAGMSVMKSIAAGIRSMLFEIPAVIADLGSKLWVAIKDVAAQALEKAKEIGTQLIEGIKAGIAERWETFKADVLAKMYGLIDATKGAFGVQSPSRVFAEIGHELMAGAAVGISGNVGAAVSAAEEAAAQVTGAFDKETKSPVFQKVTQAIDSISGALAGAIVQGRNMGEALRGVFQQIAQDLMSSGIKHLISGLFGGGGTGGGLLGGLTSSFKGFFANGGTLGAGQWGIAGEAGPEPVVGPARIIPNHKLANGQPQQIRVLVESTEDLRVVAQDAGARAGREVAVTTTAQFARMQRENQRRS
ncbi:MULTISPECIES: hypothetical protein [unclassified Marinovum]|uniref:hypothetical protein n=1 Tax=unclassified Marinovum TaxID=2647166 RepID=UPI003EDC5744